MKTEMLSDLSLDLTKEYPRSPREKLGPYVVAARTLDKCRAELNDTAGEYHYNCPLDKEFFDFTGVDANAFKEAVQEGRDDEEMVEWIQANSHKHSEETLVQWNNSLRYKRISELANDTQVFLENYIDECLPKGAIVYHWFDVYDIEEKRIQN